MAILTQSRPYSMERKKMAWCTLAYSWNKIICLALLPSSLHLTSGLDHCHKLTMKTVIKHSDSLLFSSVKCPILLLFWSSILREET